MKPPCVGEIKTNVLIDISIVFSSINKELSLS